MCMFMYTEVQKYLDNVLDKNHMACRTTHKSQSGSKNLFLVEGKPHQEYFREGAMSLSKSTKVR